MKGQSLEKVAAVEQKLALQVWNVAGTQHAFSIEVRRSHVYFRLTFAPFTFSLMSTYDAFWESQCWMEAKL